MSEDPSIDFDGDGDYEEYTAEDVEGSDSVVYSNDEGSEVAIDDDQDGLMDTLYTDSDGDGNLDTEHTDTNNDGIMDTEGSIEGEAPAGS